MTTASDLLAGYRPSTAEEEADVARIDELLVQTEDPWNRALPLHLTGSALVVHVESRRVLLRWHERQQAWLQVGGHGDPGETLPADVALREAVEETGLTDLALLDDAPLHVVIVPVPAKGAEAAHEHADVRFAVQTLSPDSIAEESPDAPLRWLSFSDASGLTREDNVRETLRRLEARLA